MNKECSLLVSDLAEGKELEFRVFAENAAGQSEPSEASNFVRICDPVYPLGIL